MENLSTCPVCSSKTFSVKLNSFDYFFTQEPFQIVNCAHCDFLFTNPRPTEANSVKYYESEDYLSHNQTKQGLFNSLYKIVRKYAVKKKAKIVMQNSTSRDVLDIGCGTGEFLSALQKKGFKVQGVEVNNSARQISQSKHQIKVYSKFNESTFHSTSIGVVTMWHVLEHVYQLHETLTGIRNILDDNGTLIVALPNHKSFDAYYYGKFWAGYDLPRHIYHFNKNNIVDLLERYNFELVKIKPMYFDSYYVSLLSEKYVRGKMNYLNALKVATQSNIKALLKTGDYSSLIYIFKLKKG